MVNTFPSGHFYSPIPDLNDVNPSKFINTFANCIAMDDSQVFQFAKDIFSYAPELASLIESGETDFRWSNDQLPPADALAYYGAIKHLKPFKIIEIGSGFSTQVAISAVKSNGYGQITCIEPYPREFLKASKEVVLIEKKLQDVPDDIFRSLKRGDVLFIDSSHQAKCQSDVLDIIFRVLDLVEVGVYIHFHDIFYPDDYPYFWLKDNGIFFNEQYFLLAYLKDNAKYTCRLPNAYLVRKHREYYEDLVSGVHQPDNECFVNAKHTFIKAGSFWLERLS